MDSMQRRSILIVLEGIEHQIKSVKSLLNVVPPSDLRPAPNLDKPQALGYTTNEDDQKMEELLAPTKEDAGAAYLHDLVMRGLARKAQQAEQQTDDVGTGE